MYSDSVPRRGSGEVGRSRRRAPGTRWAGLKAQAPVILLAALLLVGGAGAVALTLRLHNASDLSAAQPLGPASRTIVFLINGVSPADLRGAELPHLDDLASRGAVFRQAWAGQMENVGVASAASLGTGMLPRSTGMIAEQWLNPQNGTLQRPALTGQVQLGSIDEVMQSHGVEPLAVPLKRARPRARILAVGGDGCAVANAAGSWLADYVLCPRRSGTQWLPGSVTGHALPAAIAAQISVRGAVAGKGALPVPWKVGAEDDFITRYAIQAMRLTRPDLLMVSLDELAARKPVSGSGSPRTVNAVLRGVDRDIGEVEAELRREGVANRTAFVVTSGTAMPVASSTIPRSALAQAVTSAGGHQVYLGTGETATIGLQDILQAQPVALALQHEQLRGIDGIYYRSRTKRSWTYKPQYLDPDLPAAFSSSVSFLLGTFASAESPDVVAILAPGNAVVSPRDNGSDGPGVQWESQHVPLIIAGHGVQPGVISSFPARMVDIAPTIAALMGLGPVTSDGVVLSDAMQQPPDGSAALQRAREKDLDFYVSALQSRQQAAGR